MNPVILGFRGFFFFFCDLFLLLFTPLTKSIKGQKGYLPDRDQEILEEASGI